MDWIHHNYFKYVNLLKGNVIFRTRAENVKYFNLFWVFIRFLLRTYRLFMHGGITKKLRFPCGHVTNSTSSSVSCSPLQVDKGHSVCYHVTSWGAMVAVSHRKLSDVSKITIGTIVLLAPCRFTWNNWCLFSFEIHNPCIIINTKIHLIAYLSFSGSLSPARNLWGFWYIRINIIKIKNLLFRSERVGGSERDSLLIKSQKYNFRIKSIFH